MTENSPSSEKIEGFKDREVIERIIEKLRRPSGPTKQASERKQEEGRVKDNPQDQEARRE